MSQTRQKWIQKTLMIKINKKREFKSKNKFRINRKRIENNSNKKKDFDDLNLTILSINENLRLS